MLPLGARLFPAESGCLDRAPGRQRPEHGSATLAWVAEDVFVPLARRMLPGVEAAVDAFSPDVVLADEHTYAGSLVARRHGIFWATMALTAAGILGKFPTLPKARQWLDRLLAELQAGVNPPVLLEAELSPHLVLCFSVPEIVGTRHFPPHWHFIGASIDSRQDAIPFPWNLLMAGKPGVFVSLGTIIGEMGDRFYGQTIEALADEPIQVILVVPDEVVPRLGVGVPDNFIVRSRVPQLEILPHVDAVVCHAGFNTVIESLNFGLPLVLAPVMNDGPALAEQVTEQGAALWLPFGRIRANALRDAVRRVLAEPSFRHAAERIGTALQAAGGAARAADLLTGLHTDAQ